MKKSLPGPSVSTRSTESLVSILALLLAASFATGCDDEDRDEPMSTFDSSVIVGLDAAAVDSGGAVDAARPPETGTADSAVTDSGGPAPTDSGQTPMDATSSDGGSDDAGQSSDGAVEGGTDAALDGASDGAASDGAQDTGTDGSAADAGNWPPTGCDQSYRVVARGNGSGGRYQVPTGDHVATITLDAPWNTQQVQAIAFRPVIDNGQIVKRLRLENAGNGDVLTQFAMRDTEPTVLPGDVAIAMPSGTRSLRLVVRYVNETGGNRTDASGVDVCIVRQTHLRSKLAGTTKAFVALPPAIAAHETNVEVTRVCDVTNVPPVFLMSAGPYAHEYGIWAKFTVIKKDGDEIVMHHQAYELANRSMFYPLTPEVRIEQGDKIVTTCVLTNPSDDDLPAATDTTPLEELCSNLALYYPAGLLKCSTP
jgi:hypothetical protein